MVKSIVLCAVMGLLACGTRQPTGWAGPAAETWANSLGESGERIVCQEYNHVDYSEATCSVRLSNDQIIRVSCFRDDNMYSSCVQSER